MGIGHKSGFGFRATLVLYSLAASLILTFLASTVSAQQSGQLPKLQHYNLQIFARYYLADYRDAGKDFNRGFNAAYRRGNRRHLDSICFLAMMGECHYHTGNYADAMKMYDSALSIYLSYQAENWQRRLRIPAGITGNTNAYTSANITWGNSTRRAPIARVPTTFGMMFGRTDAERAFQEGGAVDNAEIYKVNVDEIMRCTALCLHRRGVIMGPTCKFAPFSANLLAGLNVAGAGNGTVMGAYNGVLLGIAQASVEEHALATRTLGRSLQIMNGRAGMDHSLTPVALIEMARSGLANKEYAAAKAVAMEASYSAAVFGQYDLVEESLSLATTLHLMTAKTPFAPLENAVLWARKNKARLMQASLIQKSAECYAESGQAAIASKVLSQANSVITNRNSLGNCVVSARLKYGNALVRFLEGDFAQGRTELNKSLSHFQSGSLWLYRLGWAQSLIANGQISQREADRIYDVLLRDPTELDWKTDPMEALAYLASPHAIAMEQWFNIVIDRKDSRRALEIADLVRRHRFFSTLPLGGRLMSLRWIMHAPEESLSNSALDQKKAFLAKNSSYRELIGKTKQIELALGVLPTKPVARSKEEREQLGLMKELAAISNRQEAILASFALRREPGDMAFPPQRPIKEFQKSIGKDQVAFVTMATATGYHLFLVKSTGIQYLDPINSKLMIRGVGNLLKKMGLSDAALDVKTLQETDWKETASNLKKAMFGTVQDTDWKDFKELLIVPDGVLWYVPFEALPVTDGDEEKYLSDLVSIRYSPTLFLGYETQRPEDGLKGSAVVTARMHSRGEGELSGVEFDDFVKLNPDAVQYSRPVQIPTNYLVSIFDQLIVWSEIKATKNGPMAMNPMQIDLNKPGSNLESWMALPWAGAKHVVLPGLTTDGGSGMRGKFYGRDLFLTSIGLMASGTRTALLSRWATGGKSAIEFTKSYATEMPKSGPFQAVYESRVATRAAELDYANEPRVRVKKTDPVLKAEHPFFWAAHMLFSIPDGKTKLGNINPEAGAVDLRGVDPDAPADKKPADAEEKKVGENEEGEMKDGEAEEKANEAKPAENEAEQKTVLPGQKTADEKKKKESDK